MAFASFRREDWPPSAWLLRLPRRDNAAARLEHGSNVETGDAWFCEGVWDAPFSGGAFDQTDCFFGSGGHWRDGTLLMVPSWAPCDRLHSIQAGDDLLVSNSLPCLLAGAPARLAVQSESYIRICNSILLGVEGYLRDLPTDQGPILLTYCQNLSWDGHGLRQVHRTVRRRSPGSFEEYRGFLSETLARIAANMADPLRRRPLSFLAGISRGYDSLAVCVLARKHGLRETFTCRESRHFESDDGSPFARALGLDVHCIGRMDWQKRFHPEIPFIAGDGTGNGMEIAALDDGLLRDRVLLSGWFGDKTWSRDSDPARFEGYRGENYNGLYLTEFRLWKGFVHLPVPFLGVGDLPDIVKISRAPSMAPWDHAPENDPSYSRPICRRIIEEAGIARGTFATEKLGTMSSGRELRYTTATRRALRAWRHRRSPGLRGSTLRFYRTLRSAAGTGFETLIITLTRCLPRNGKLREQLWRVLLRWRRDRFHRTEAVGWALEEATRRYARAKLE